MCTSDGSNQRSNLAGHISTFYQLLLRVMDSSGFLSPKANAFSIAHLIDRAQLADLAFLQQNPNYHWNSQVLLREMEGIIQKCVLCVLRAGSICATSLMSLTLSSYRMSSIIELRPLEFAYPAVFLKVHCRLSFVICFTERLMNAGTGKRTPLRGADNQLMPEDSDEGSDNGRSPNSSPPPTQSSCSQANVRPLCPGLINARVDLEMKSLWEEFHSLGTEMIVTKAGRYV